jgi:outer membrane lipoprotein-sorting protein
MNSAIQVGTMIAAALLPGVLVGQPLGSTGHAFAQNGPDVAQILESVSRVYSSPNQYTLHATVTEETFTSGKGTVTSAAVVIAVKRPEQVRFEVNRSGSTEFTGMYVGDELAVSDGTNFFLYLPKFHQYTKTPLHFTGTAHEPITPMGTVPAFIDHVEATFLDWYKVVAGFADRAQFLREESVGVDGTPVSCYVIEIENSPNPKRTIWVDKSRSVVLREILDLQNPENLPSLTKTTVFSATQFGAPLKDDLFVFSPPAGAKLVDAFGQK